MIKDHVVKTQNGKKMTHLISDSPMHIFICISRTCATCNKVIAQERVFQSLHAMAAL